MRKGGLVCGNDSGHNEIGKRVLLMLHLFTKEGQKSSMKTTFSFKR